MSARYKTIFSSIIKPVVSKDYDTYCAKASLDQLRHLIPDVDQDKNYDLLPISANLFNVNLFNKNDDGVDTEFALRIYKSFINKPWNIGHSRDKNVGVILTAHITEMGSDKLLTEDDVKSINTPFNISVGGVIWRVVNEGLADLIENSNSVLDDNYNKIFTSFEVGFMDYKLVKCPANSRNLCDGSILEDAEEIADCSKHLKAFGGTGKLKDGSRVYRLLSGDGLGLGGAITESPAAFLNAIAVPLEKEEVDDTIDKTEANASELDDAIKRVAEIAVEVESKIISHLDTSTVIKNKNSNIRNPMKITNIKDITDDLLKEATASSIVDFVEQELKVASEKFAQEKLEKETASADLKAKHDELLKVHETLTKDLESLKDTVAKFEQEKVAKDKQEKFTVRMASFEDKFELSQDELAVVGSQIKDLDDEQYKTVEANLFVLLKNKDKQIVAEQKKLQETKAEVKVEDATQTAQQTVDSAINKAEVVSKEVAATSSAQIPTQTLREKYAKAFSVSEFIIGK